MGGTAELFPELGQEQEPLTPAGFRYQEKVITAAEEATLVAALQKLISNHSSSRVTSPIDE
jgi:hypothetical protein